MTETIEHLNRRLRLPPDYAPKLLDKSGKPWSEDDEVLLAKLFYEGAHIEVMCNVLERTPGGILSRLEVMKIIRDTGWHSDPHTRYEPRKQVIKLKAPACALPDISDLPFPFHSTTQEQPMTQELKIETKAFINGTDAKNLNDQTLFTLIADEIKAIDDLEALPVKSKKLAAHIAKRREQVDKVTNYLDER